MLTPEQTAFLESQRVARLATVDEQACPHVLPICYALLDGILYTPIDEKPKRGNPTTLRRVRNILANPRVALTVDHYEEDWTKIGYLLILGMAQVIETGGERPEALPALRAKYRQYARMDLEAQPLIVITPARVTGWGIYRH